MEKTLGWAGHRAAWRDEAGLLPERRPRPRTWPRTGCAELGHLGHTPKSAIRTVCQDGVCKEVTVLTHTYAHVHPQNHTPAYTPAEPRVRHAGDVGHKRGHCCGARPPWADLLSAHGCWHLRPQR